MAPGVAHTPGVPADPRMGNLLGVEAGGERPEQGGHPAGGHPVSAAGTRGRGGGGGVAAGRGGSQGGLPHGRRGLVGAEVMLRPHPHLAGGQHEASQRRARAGPGEHLHPGVLGRGQRGEPEGRLDPRRPARAGGAHGRTGRDPRGRDGRVVLLPQSYRKRDGRYPAPQQCRLRDGPQEIPPRRADR